MATETRSKIKECTDRGVHEAVLKDFFEYKAKLSTKILILGAGYGALDEKLLCAGYCNITAVDISNKYQAKNTNFVEFDLNNNFFELFNEKFDYIFIIEVIEHLENLFHFFRNIKKIAKNDSVIFVTTPNIHRKSLRFVYFLTGEVEYFREKDIYESGHITPIFDHIFRHVLDNTGFLVLSKTYNRYLIGNSIVSKVKEIIYKLLTCFVSGDEGVISIYKIVPMETEK